MDVFQLFHLNSNSYKAQAMYAPGESYEKNPPGKRYPPNGYDVIPEHSDPAWGNDVKSTRQFDPELPLSQGELFSLLHSSYLVKRDGAGQHSTAPSAGGLFPVEFYVINLRVPDLRAGIYHYQKHSGSLSYLSGPIEELSFLANVNRFAENSSFLIVMTANLENVTNKYGARGYRYALIECGHLGQNLSIVTEKMNIGCCPIGGYYDLELNDLLNLNANEVSLYVYAVGRIKP